MNNDPDAPNIVKRDSVSKLSHLVDVLKSASSNYLSIPAVAIATACGVWLTKSCSSKDKSDEAVNNSSKNVTKHEQPGNQASREQEKPFPSPPHVEFKLPDFDKNTWAVELPTVKGYPESEFGDIIRTQLIEKLEAQGVKCASHVDKSHAAKRLSCSILLDEEPRPMPFPDKEEYLFAPHLVITLTAATESGALSHPLLMNGGKQMAYNGPTAAAWLNLIRSTFDDSLEFRAFCKRLK